MEEWRDVPAFNGVYEISSFGNVRSLRAANLSQRRLTENKIKHLYARHAEGVSARKIAKEIGVSQTVVSKIIRGVAYKSDMRVLKPALRKDGYLFVTLSIDNVHWHKTIHSMVASAFIGARPKGRQVNHKNGDKTDNRVDNLEYVTPSENAIHALSVLKTRRKISREQVHDIKQAKLRGDSRASIAKKHNISIHMVTAIWMGKSWAFEH